MNEKVHQLIATALPDAQVEFEDFKNDNKHFLLTVTSAQFKNRTLIEQHRLVMTALKGLLDSGELHAIKIKTLTA